MNTIGEPCDRKGHARIDGEVLAWGSNLRWGGLRAGRKRPGFARLPKDEHPCQCLTLHGTSTKDGEVRFDQNGRPRMRVAPELNAQVTLVRENFVSGLMAFTSNTFDERPDDYRKHVEAQQLAGTAVFEQQAHDVALAVELLRQQEAAQAALEAAAAAQVAQEAAAAEVPTPGRNRSRANAQVESLEAQAS